MTSLTSDIASLEDALNKVSVQLGALLDPSIGADAGAGALAGMLETTLVLIL